MKTVEVRHPLVQHKIGLLRDASLSTKDFRELASEVATLLTYEATRDLPMTTRTIETPICSYEAPVLAGKKLAIVPILRAGLGMLEGMVKLVPTAEVGFLGMKRNEETLVPESYAERLPEKLHGRQCFVLDPMLATGGSLAAAIEFLFDRGADEVTAICVLGTPEGIAAVREQVGDRNVTLVLGALDDGLNENAYIVPGLGDAGDRLYGTAD